MLGGEDNHEVDRIVRDTVAEIAPRQSDVAWMNRRWLHRVVRYLAGCVGIDQFLDLGAGLPTVCNTHEIAQQHNPNARVVYVDNDPLCALHGRALVRQHLGRVDRLDRGHRVVFFLLNDLVGLLKDHAVTTLFPATTRSDLV
ncbi:SAM-dependent methyltransferase [Nocardia nova]|nr:SAM-dependent methyltransferase [Nocardia nova]